MNEDKLQITIQKINTDTDFFKKEGQASIAVLSNFIETKGYSNQEIQVDYGGYEICVFYKKGPLKPKWKNFFIDTVKEGQSILKENQSFSESFILLIYGNKTKNLYSIAGGFGFHVVQDFIDDNFGIDILSRLIKKDSKILNSVKEKAIMGGIQGSTKYFRKKYNLFENDSFGKIYQELKTDIDKNLLEKYFGFSTLDIKNQVTCIAKSSFKINKSVDFEGIFKIIAGCEDVLNNPNLNPVDINGVEKILKKKNLSLIKKLEDELMEQLWKRYNYRNECIDFDLCHNDFEKYLTASKYIVTKGSSYSNYFKDYEFVDDNKLDYIDKIFDLFTLTDTKFESKEDFEKLMKNLTIASYSQDDDSILTRGPLIRHIFGDVTYGDMIYFLIDGSWYKIKQNFITNLNISCETFIKNNYYGGIIKKWDRDIFKDENVYNQSYIGEDNTLVLDKITPENIEPCDILTWNDRDLYLVHVKEGFGNTMRDLCSQIFISGKRLQEDISSDKDYIDKIYDSMVAKKDSSDEYFKKIANQISSVSKDDFRKLFTEKKLIFVLAVKDAATSSRSIKDNIKGFRSNIAKFSLQELVKSMRGMDIRFEFVQIPS